MIKVRSFFFRILFLVTLTAIIPLIIANYTVSEQARRALTRNYETRILTNLHRSALTANLLFETIDQTQNQLSISPDIIQTVYTATEDNQSLKSRAFSSLRNLAVSHDYIHSVYLYIARSGTILTSDGENTSIEEFYDRHWLTALDTFFLGTSRSTTRVLRDSHGNRFSVFSFIKRVPYDSWDTDGYLIVNINQSAVARLLAGTDELQDETMVITDQNSTIISHLNTALIGHILQSREDPYGYSIYAQETLSVIPWVLSLQVTQSALQHDLNQFSRLVMLITLFLIGLGAGISYLSARRLYFPVVHLMELIAENQSITPDRLDELGWIENTFTRIQAENLEMRSNLDRFTPSIQERTFHRLLQSQKMEETELRETMDFLGIDPSKFNWCVLKAQTEEDNPDTPRNHLKQVIFIRSIKKISAEYRNREILSGTAFETADGAITMVIGIAVETQDKQKTVDTFCRTILKSSIRNYKSKVFIGIGSIQSSLTTLPVAGRESGEALRFQRFSMRQGFTWYEIVPGGDSYSNALSDDITQLLTTIRNGNANDAADAVKMLVHRCSGIDNSSQIHIRSVILSVLNKISLLLAESDTTLADILQEENVFFHIEQTASLGRLTNRFTEIITAVTLYMSERKSGQENHHVRRMQEYISNHIDRDVSLGEVAEYAGLSSSYASTLFSHITGMNFVEYVSKERIHRAEQLLRESALTVSEIGFHCGFNSIQSFVRTFKKYTEKTPGRYRKEGLSEAQA